MQSIWSSLLLQVDIPIFTEDHKVHRTAEHLFLLFSRILDCFSWFRFYLLMFQSAAARESCSEVEMTLLISLTPTRTLTCQRTTPEMYQVMKTLLNLVSVLSQLSTSDVLSTWPTPPTPEMSFSQLNQMIEWTRLTNSMSTSDDWWCLAKSSHIFILFLTILLCRCWRQDSQVDLHSEEQSWQSGLLDQERRAPCHPQQRRRRLHIRPQDQCHQPPGHWGLGAEHCPGQDDWPWSLRVPGQHWAQDQPGLQTQCST